MKTQLAKKFHHFISFVLQPLLIPTYAVLILLFSNMSIYYPKQWKYFALGGTFVFTALIPLIPMLILYGRGLINSMYITKREERTLPYIFTFISYVFWNFFLWNVLKLPFFFVVMGVSATASILITLLINLKWKISAHMGGIGGLTGAVVAYCMLMGSNPVGLIVSLFILVGLTALARLELKAHTPAQVVAGFLLGFFSVFAPVIFL